MTWKATILWNFSRTTHQILVNMKYEKNSISRGYKLLLCIAKTRLTSNALDLLLSVFSNKRNNYFMVSYYHHILLFRVIPYGRFILIIKDLLILVHITMVYIINKQHLNSRSQKKKIYALTFVGKVGQSSLDHIITLSMLRHLICVTSDDTKFFFIAYWQLDGKHVFFHLLWKRRNEWILVNRWGQVYAQRYRGHIRRMCSLLMQICTAERIPIVFAANASCHCLPIHSIQTLVFYFSLIMFILSIPIWRRLLSSWFRILVLKSWYTILLLGLFCTNQLKSRISVLCEYFTNRVNLIY